MSHTSNQINMTWKVVESRIRRHALTYHGDALSPRDLHTVQSAYSLWYLMTHDTLVSDGTPDVSVPLQWIDSICSEDVYVIGSLLKDCDEILLNADLNFQSYDSFKHYLRKDYPAVGAILAPIRRILERWFSSEDHSAFRLCHSWFCFITRINIVDSEFLKRKALNDYLAIEDGLKSDGFSTEESDLISSWYPRTLELNQYYTDRFVPRHSNGSTADSGRHLAQKYKNLGSDYLINYLWSSRNIDWPRPPRMLATFCRRARVKLVGKSLTSYRTISMEPSTLMWHQQGIFHAFCSDLLKRPGHPLRKRFRPDNQEPNRALAWEGSIDGSFATVDLSSASDSVSWNLVKNWFGKTCLYPWMLATRSSEAIMPDEGVIALKKYAPMGSALCFPTECIVFAAIAECSIIECGGDPATSRYCVYGDDIVIESEYAHTLIRRLTMNGFKVNTQKSFVGTNSRWYFRESCGGHYLDGEDVTPIRLSRKFSGLTVSTQTPSRIENLIELANDCNSQYPSVRRRCIDAVNQLPKHLRVPFNDSGEGGFFSTEPTNWHLGEPRWSEDYQTSYYFIGFRKSKRGQRDLEVEDFRLYEYLRQSDGRKRLSYPEDRVVVDLRHMTKFIWATKASYEAWEEIFL